MILSNFIKRQLSPYNTLFPRQSPYYCRITAKYTHKDDEHEKPRKRKKHEKGIKITESEQEEIEKAKQKPKALQGYDEELINSVISSINSSSESDDEDKQHKCDKCRCKDLKKKI
jgi:hypothetical protein